MSHLIDDPATTDASTKKVAIAGFSLLGKQPIVQSKQRSRPPPSPGKRPRNTFAYDSASESDNDAESRSRHEAVTGMEDGGAIKRDENKKAEPLVIPKIKNRDWRRGRATDSSQSLPTDEEAPREAVPKTAGNTAKDVPPSEGVDVVNSVNRETQWGLTITKQESASDGAGYAMNVHAAKITSGNSKEPEEHEVVPKQTADEEAIVALMGKHEEKKGPGIIIASLRTHEYEPAISEQDAYRRAIESAPNVSTLEDYEKVPVEEFGAALLRGMGWDGIKRAGTREVKKRQNLLGLGAKELKEAEDLGAWVQKSDVKRLKGNRSGRNASRFGDRVPNISEYRREKEKRDEKREEMGGGSYRRERERKQDRHRSTIRRVEKSNSARGS